jgi:tetratricopeptide (TPR) repeat protein
LGLKSSNLSRLRLSEYLCTAGFDDHQPNISKQSAKRPRLSVSCSKFAQEVDMKGLRGKTGSLLLVLLTSSSLGGCAAMISNAASGLAENLSAAMLNQDDPETVRAGMPSYMILMDSFVEGSPDDPAMLSAAANLYASYGAVFVDDKLRASRLTTRARNYASAAMCRSYSDACSWDSATYDEFVSSLQQVTAKQADLLYVYGFTMLAYIRAHSSDWNALAELPQAEALLERYLEIAGDGVKPAAHTYIGVLQTIRPPSMGGKPEEARAHFEKAIEMTGGRDLSVKVEYAKGYAKTLYERELHDQLVGEVLTASPYVDGYTLLNVLAQEDAARMALEADDYF